MSKSPALWKPVLIAALILMAAADLLSGGGGISLPEGAVLWKLRLPRVLTALLAGSALALSGAQMQALFRNPLADPHIMGVSSGAGLGAAIAALAASSAVFSGWTLVAAAFAGALVASVLILRASLRLKHPGTLLIFGVMLGFIFSACSSVLQYSAGEESLKIFYNWMAGSFSAGRYADIALMGGTLLTGLLLAVLNGKGLDLTLFGEPYTRLSGGSPRRILTLSMISCCLMTGTVTAFCGPVGFVGIVAPHVVRYLSGRSDHRCVLPWSMVSGAALALTADAAANLSRVPLPVGSTMAFIGIPFILVLMLRSK